MPLNSFIRGILLFALVACQASYCKAELTEGDSLIIEIKKIREEALKISKKGNFKKAAQLLEYECGDTTVPNDSLRQAVRWCLSDYTLYLFKSGQIQKCIQDISWRTWPGFSSNNAKLERSFQHNFELCRSAKLEELGKVITTETCPFIETKSSKLAVSLPSHMLNADTEAACIDFAQTKSCPKMFLYEKNKLTQIVKKTRISVVEARDGFLTDASFCCNLQKITIVKKDSEDYIMLNGRGPTCDVGGTANAELNMTYSLKGTQIKQKGRLSISYH